MFKDKNRGEDLFESFDNFRTTSKISYNKIVSIFTNGVSAMLEKRKGISKENMG